MSYHKHFNSILFCLYFIKAPIPSISITFPNTQTVGQSLILQCDVTAVRGITSRVDILWISGGIVLERINGTTATTMDNSLIYTDFYIISQLSTTDDSRVIQCKGIIQAMPSQSNINMLTLNVTGKRYLWYSELGGLLHPLVIYTCSLSHLYKMCT